MSSPTLKPGDVLAGKYRVERILGAGGMGYVVAARHLQLDQLVAMKFLRKGAVDNGEAEARFLREAKAVVKLRNEHIAKVYDVGTLESGEPYIVMEHLDGCDLAELAKERHVLPAAEVCEYILQACEALAEAHSLQIVHRDIKLANLFVTRGPTGGPLVKVLDFGISKTNPLGESEHDMTRTASMLGSPRFMSPEQMRDPRSVDGRSDIWSLGVVMYRLVSGRPPFEADTLGRLLTMVMHENEPPLASLRRDLPPGFCEVVSHCLEKSPEDRYTNVAELAYALAPFSMDPARASSAAERIAAVLSLPHPPPSDLALPHGGGMSSSRSSRASRPGDGTASPWSGTHGGSRWHAPRGATVWFGVAFALLLLGSVFLAKTRVDAQAAAAAPELEETPTVALGPRQTGVPASAPQEFEPRTRGESGIIGASPLPPPPLPTMTVTSMGTAPETTPVPRRQASSPTPRPKAAPTTRTAPPPRGEVGIPTTRD